MPKLPDFQALGDIRSFESGRPTRNITIRNDGMVEAGRALIEGGDRIANFVAGQRREQAALDAAKADADFITRQTEFETKLKDDPNFQGWADTYRTEAPKLLEQAAASITDPKTRELWMARQQAHIARGVARFTDAARARGNDAEIAGVSDQLDTLHRTYIEAQSEEDRQRVVDSARGLIDGLVARGAIHAAQGQRLGRTWVERSAAGSLDVLSPTDRIAALGGNVAALRQRESGGIPTKVNQFGYAGLFQFGAPRLADMGVYQPGAGESLDTWSKTGRDVPGKWTGTFNIPGFPEVKTLKDFLANPAAQEAAYKIHDAKMEQEIKANGLDRFIGQNVAGIPITLDGVKNMMHLGGAGGARRALESGGTDVARDANGTSVLDYARMGATSGRAAQLAQFLPPDARARMLDKAEAEWRADERRQHAAHQDERAQLAQQIKDDLASVQTTGQGLPPETINRDRIATMLGENHAAEWEADRARAQRVFEVVDGAQTLPEAAIRARLDAMAPVPGTAGYADDLKAYHAAQAAVGQIITARRKDVAAAADAFPFVQQARSAAAADAQANPGSGPAGVQSVISARLAAQDQMRVPGSQQRPLTHAEVATTVESITGPDAQQGSIRDRLNGLAAQYGEHWPRVFGQLVTDGKLPGAYQVLAQMTEPTQRVAADQLQRGLALVAQKGGWAKLRDGEESGTIKRVEDAVTADLIDLRRATTYNTGGDALYSAVHEAAKVLAYSYVHQNGDVTGAADQAVKNILRERWEITGTAVYPKAQAGEVRGAMDAVQRSLTPAMLEQVPATPDTAGMTDEARQASWLRAARNGKWVPNRDTTGLVLMARLFNGGMIPVRAADGQPIELRFDALPRVTRLSGPGADGRPMSPVMRPLIDMPTFDIPRGGLPPAATE